MCRSIAWQSLVVGLAIGGLGVGESSAQVASPDTFALARDAFFQDDVRSAFSLFATAVRQSPTDAERQAWLAEAARRLELYGFALHHAREAVRLEPCHAFGHEILGHLFNVQQSRWELADASASERHYETAVRCDPSAGSVWMSLWISALSARDSAAERRAIAGISASGIISAPWMSHGRWVLRSLPRGALALAAGDLDTYPPVMHQVESGERLDVVIVNTSLLRMPWYAERLREVHGLPLPSNHLAEDGTADAEAIFRHWGELAADGALGRPLVWLMSMGMPGQELRGGTTFAGTHWRLGESGPALDAAALDAVRAIADSLDWRGPRLSPRDRSSVRNAYAVHPVRYVIYMIELEAELTQGGLPDGSLQWIEQFVARSGEDDAGTREAMAALRSTRAP